MYNYTTRCRYPPECLTLLAAFSKTSDYSNHVQKFIDVVFSVNPIFNLVFSSQNPRETIEQNWTCLFRCMVAQMNLFYEKGRHIIFNNIPAFVRI